MSVNYRGPCEAAPSAAAALPCAPRVAGATRRSLRAELTRAGTWRRQRHHLSAPAPLPAPEEAVLGHCSALRQLPLQGSHENSSSFAYGPGLRERGTQGAKEERMALLCAGVWHNGALMVKCS